MRKILLASIAIIIYCNINSQVITTIAGTGVQGNSGDGGPATSAQINLVYFAAVDASGNVYFSDYNGNTIRKISTSGIVTIFAGTGSAGYTGDGGLATSATLNRPIGLAFDKQGNLYVGDNKNNVVRKIATNGIITTVVGTGSGAYGGDGGPATAAQINNPNGIAVDTAGNIFICDYYNNCIRKVTKATGIITTVAGIAGGGGFSGDGGLATSAKLNSPIYATVDAAGNIFICDGGNTRIRKVATNGIINTVIGNAGPGFSGDGGQASAAKLGGIGGLYVEPSGAIVLSDYGNNRLRKIAPNGIITTIAGNGSQGFSGDDGLATSAALFHPLGVTEDAAGNIYFSDLDNHRIRKIATQSLPTITSFSPTSGGNNSTVVISGTGLAGATAVSFGGVAAKSFTVDSDIKITAKVGTGASGVVSVTTSGGTATKAGFVFCVTPSVKITSDATASVCAGKWITFIATATNGGPAPVYQWQKNGANVGGNISTYADSTLKTGDTVRCVLTSNASPCVVNNNPVSNALTFTVNPNIVSSVAITSNPANTAICLGGKIIFSATATNGGTSPVYQWMKKGIAVGNNTNSYTDDAPATGDTVYVLLTSNAACVVPPTVPSNKLTERVDVPNPVIKIASDKGTTICDNTSVTFTATVTPAYMWQKNGVTVGTNSNQYVDSTLNTNDKVQCFLVSSATACNNNPSNIINSNLLTYKVNTPPAIPAAITGPATVKAGQTGIYYSVKAVAGVTYAWALPSGAVIDSGQGGNKIKVSWGNTSGNVSVIAINSCGSSAAQAKAVTIKASLAAETIAESAGKKQLETGDDIRLTPNPASTWATVTFSAKTQAKYVVTITDAQSNILEIKTGVTVKGVNTVKINTARYAKGAYFVTITNKENGQRGKELIIGQ